MHVFICVLFISPRLGHGLAHLQGVSGQEYSNNNLPDLDYYVKQGSYPDKFEFHYRMFTD
jgi:hypothetical protein